MTCAIIGQRRGNSLKNRLLLSRRRVFDEREKDGKERNEMRREKKKGKKEGRKEGGTKGEKGRSNANESRCEDAAAAAAAGCIPRGSV